MPKRTKLITNRDMVCKLLKALYSLKQSFCFLYKRLSSFLLEKLRLKQINVNHSIFVINIRLNAPVVSTFIDDIKIMAPKRSGIIKQAKLKLTSAFSLVGIGPFSFYLGLKVKYNPENQ